MTQRDFAPIADSLRRAVISFYQEPGALDGPAGINTLETNSGYVERRGAPLLDLLGRSRGCEPIDGLQVADLGCGFGALSLYFAARGATVIGIDPIGSRLEVGRRRRGAWAQGRVRDRADGGSGARRCELRSRGPKQQPCTSCP